MQIVHQGFDGLDVTFQGQLPDDFMDLLEEAQLQAQDERRSVLREYGGVTFLVESSGARHGYKFRIDTGEEKAKWFFKDTRRKNNDPWNMRVSCHSLGLALHGLGKVREEMYEFLDKIGARLPVNAERISRVDYAIDLWAPEFELDANSIVMHSRFNLETNEELLTGNGCSGQLNSVKIGKLPGKQVAVYNKRREIVSSRKSYWWNIWRAGGLPNDLDTSDPVQSRIWRVELRSGKDHLRRQWGILSWSDLFDRCGDMLLSVTDNIRYCEPGIDQNRSRWSNHEIWETVKEALGKDLMELTSGADISSLKEVIRKDHSNMILNQIVGLAANLTVAERYTRITDDDYFSALFDKIKKAISKDPVSYSRKLRKAQERYIFL